LVNEASLIAPLLQPLSIRGMTIPNRLVMAPMTRSFCPEGLPGAENIAYYRRRAEGELGMIVTEAIGTDHPAAIGDAGMGEHDLPLFNGPASVDAWRAVVDAVHDAGSVIVPQVWHQGVLRLPGSPPFPDVPSFSPSGRYGDVTKTDPWFRAKGEILSRPGRIPTDAEIVEVLDSFGSAAEHAVAAGFDGFAIHGAHGYLIDAFLWGETNLRTDRWGGDLRARTLFAVELIRRVRRVIGEDRPLIYRFSQWKQQDYRAKLAESPAELEQILGPLADAGVDLFDASVRYFDTPAFPGSDLSLAGWAKKLTGKLSGAVGGVGFDKGMYDTFENKPTGASNNLPRVLRRFEAGEFDVVSVGRAILNDPAWVGKAKRGEPFAPFDQEMLKRLI
jgi:2,4-dienoyl-CoA reductase-like NADH-dependent reductase (Old Yellow Enzyme family)